MRKKTLGEMPSAEQLEAELKREKYKRRYHSRAPQHDLYPDYGGSDCCAGCHIVVAGIADLWQLHDAHAPGRGDHLLREDPQIWNPANIEAFY